MSEQLFDSFFSKEAKLFLLATLRIALSEDGPDLTSQALFTEPDIAQAQIIAKQDTIVCGLPLIPLILEFSEAEFQTYLNADDGDFVHSGTLVASLQGPAAHLLKAERVILNFLTHLSGIANLTNQYVAKLQNTQSTLLDTRKTLPGLRYPEKYAVLCGGAQNHRLNLAEMLMLKDNHIDRAGSIIKAVKQCRDTYKPCPAIEIECRSLAEVEQAVACNVERIMLDNMDFESMAQALRQIPQTIETEISGNISLENIHDFAQLGANFISVGRLTHSAPASDFSMQILL